MKEVMLWCGLLFTRACMQQEINDFLHVDTDDELFFPRFEAHSSYDSRSMNHWSNQPWSASSKPRASEASMSSGSSDQHLSLSSARYFNSGTTQVNSNGVYWMAANASSSTNGRPTDSSAPSHASGSTYGHHHLEFWRDPAAMLVQCATQCSQDFNTSLGAGSTASSSLPPVQWTPCEAWPHYHELRDLYGAFDEWSHSERLDLDDDSDQSDLYSDVSDSDASTASNVSVGNLAIDCPEAVCANGCVVFCSICLDDCTSGERIRTVAVCGHQFHADCLETWLQRRGRCPNCRRSVSCHSFD
jgi:hypothetical protein